MIAQVTSGAVLGVDAFPIVVEVDLSSGLQAFHVVGLPDGSIREARMRIQSALGSCDLSWPNKRITVNLAPAHLRKEGSAYDTPIAIALLAASKQCAASGPDWSLRDFMILGELSLTGELRPVRGVLPVAIEAKRAGMRAIIVPHENAHEASIVEGLCVLPARHLRDLVAFFRGESNLSEYTPTSPSQPCDAPPVRVDFREVRGQEHAKRALEVAAAGGHNVLMIGSPGAGKTMLARRLPTILPPMSFAEALETTQVYSIMGKLTDGEGLVAHRPFRSPHHTISPAGLVGGGSGVPRPGEISLAHNGVLFLDELPEFEKRTLEVLRQPLEDEEVSLTRSMVSLKYPASVTLVASMNPCPCGFSGDPQRSCSCAPHQITRYRSRLSGPLLDRIDIHIEVPAVRYRDLRASPDDEGSSTALFKRVQAARDRQRARFADSHLHCNAQMQTRDLDAFCTIDDAGHKLMERVVDKLGMSARTFSRILKVARTIADLDASESIQLPHLAEAVQYRLLDRQQSAY